MSTASTAATRRKTQVIDAANTHPMMVPRRLVLVSRREALIPKRESVPLRGSGRLTAFIKAPAPHSTVVFVCGSLDKRRKISSAQGKPGRGLRND
jgi:hypothetical protein